jgi:hypothetical protein
MALPSIYLSRDIKSFSELYGQRLYILTMNYFRRYDINYITQYSEVQVAGKTRTLSSLNDAITTVNQVDTQGK